MSNEHLDALEQIMRLCGESRTYTRRVQLINNVAMRAVGMTANQRHEVHIAIMDRVGDEPMKKRYLERREKAIAKMQEYIDSKNDESEFA